MRAVVTDPADTARLRLAEAPQPEPAANQALIKVEAFSLNAGETRRALEATDSYVPGWDFAGVIEETAADGGTRPRALGSTASSRRVPGRSTSSPGASLIAKIPDGVSATQAAALPVAGVTALAGLDSGRRSARTPGTDHRWSRRCRALRLPVGQPGRREGDHHQPPPDPATATARGRHPRPHRLPHHHRGQGGRTLDVILDGVGGDSLATALAALAPGGVCVSFGNGSRRPASFDPVDFYYTPGARLQGLWLGNLMAAGTDCGPMLSRLVDLVRQGRLHSPIDDVLPWTEVGQAAERLAGRRVDGKIVLEVR